MDLAELAGLCEEVTWLPGRRQFMFRCPSHDKPCASARMEGGHAAVSCDEGCSQRMLLGGLGLTAAELANGGPPNGKVGSGSDRGLVILKTQHAQRDEETDWVDKVAVIAQRLRKNEPGFDRDRIIQGVTDTLPTIRPPQHLAQEEVAGLVAMVVDTAIAEFPVKPRRQEVILCENADQAIVSNAEYLSRPAVVSRLYYTQHISLGVGGKHEGKTTNVRTEALAIAMGKPMYGRETMQTPVIYAASDDEYPTTRMELLRMGWNPSIPLTLARIRLVEGQAADVDHVLEDIARLALKQDARFVVLDMLFDFVRIADELKYAHTREAIGKIQQLADAISGHVRSTHHSPKWMPDAASAAKAALGSQGIAARFSPILLSKRWADGLFTVESTMTRDPRGLALPVTCIERDALGWATSVGEFKSWMKWKVYADRIIGLFEGGEPGREMSVAAVVQDLEIPRPEAQNALYQMSKEGGPLTREKRGKSYQYRLKVPDLFTPLTPDGT